VPTRSHRSHRHSPRRNRLQLLAIATSAVLLLLVLLLSAWTQTNSTSEHANVDSSLDESHFDQDALPIADVEPGGAQRPNYRYSVIPGGAYNALELRQAIHDDAVVAAHYEHLDQATLRVERVPHDRYVHVSYRKGNNIFWTKKKVLLRQGETILTDGKTEVRARCGNCISEEPQQPTAADDPDTVEFDRLTDAAWPSEPPSGETTLVPIVPIAAPSSLAAVAAVVPTAGSPDPIAAGRFSTGGAPLPLAAGRAGGRTPVPSPDVPADGGENPAGPPSTLFPLPPDTPTIPPGFDNPFSPPGENPQLPPPGITNLTPPGTPQEPMNPVPVPEPGTLLLVGAGVAAVIRKLRSRAS